MNYPQLRAETEEAIRGGLLDAAVRLLADEGPAALSLRHITSEMGCSTTVIYSLFGSKQGLANALYLEGFDRLGQALAQVDETLPPIAHLQAISRVYWNTSIQNAACYGVMFGGTVPFFKPPSQSRKRAWSTLKVTIRAVERGMKSGEFVTGDPVKGARLIWVVMHGVVSLQFSGYFEKKDRPNVLFDEAVAAALQKLRG
jgi:AcrR family transcriptional regulator